MRKKIYLSALIFSIILCGCGDNTNSKVLVLSDTISEGDEQNTDENMMDSDEETSEETENASEKKLLLDLNRNSALYVTDKGEFAERVDISKYADTYNGPSVFAINEDDVYTYEYYSNDDGSSGYTVCVDNITTGESKELTKCNYLSLDIYNGMLIVTDYDFENEKRQEYCFDLITHEQVDKNSELCALTDGYMIVNAWEEGIEVCLDRLMDEKGCIILQRTGDYYVCDGEKIEEISLPDDMKYIKFYNSDYIVFSKLVRAEYGEDELYVYNRASGESTFISDKYSRYLRGNNEYVYWLYVDDSDYGKNTYTLYSYSIAEGRVDELITENSMPGHDIEPVEEGFTLDGNNVYYLANETNGIVWRMYDREAQSISNVEGSLIEDEYSSLGVIKGYNYVLTCDKCGEALYKYYDEYFEFNDTLLKDEIRDKVNENLKARVCNEIKESDLNGIYSDPEDGCEYHGTSYGVETSEGKISSVYTIGSKYVVVNTNSYWYGGGAHGYPFRDSMLFDITTGEEVSIRELFDGDESELKDIVASATKADYLASMDDDMRYFLVGEDQCYQNAYESISFDNFPVEWKENGLMIMYPPYEMGCFAAGYICVDISYEDMGIKEKMEAK